MNVKRRELLKSLGVITASSAFTATGSGYKRSGATKILHEKT